MFTRGNVCGWLVLLSDSYIDDMCIGGLKTPTCASERKKEERKKKDRKKERKKEERELKKEGRKERDGEGEMFINRSQFPCEI